jgi:hypothetical protein
MFARRLSSIFILAVTMLAPLLVVTPARAQFGAAAGFADAFRPEFLDRDMPLFVEQLELEDWQRPIIEMLLQDYATAFELGVEQVKEKMRESAVVIGNSGRNDDAMKMILEPITAWDAARRQLREEFLLNVRAQLSSDQNNRWSRFERSLRREKELPKGEISGESLDLYLMARTLRMPYEIEELIDPLLVQYELELDAALEARSRRIDSLQDSIKDAMTSMNFDQGLEATDKIMETRVAIRRIQDRWVDQISNQLPEDYGVKFRRNALERGYPKAFRPTAIPRLLESVRTITDLSADQVESFDQIEGEFDAQLMALQQRIILAIQEFEPTEPRLRVERLIERRNGNAQRREPSRADTLVAEKNDLVDETRLRILAVLTPEQTGEIPGGSSARPNGTRRGGPGSPPNKDGVRPGTPEAGRGANKFFKEPPKIGSARGGESVKSGSQRTLDPAAQGGKGKGRGTDGD